MRLPALLAAALLLVAPGRARAIDDVLTPRGVAMGGAGRASAIGALGPLLNPAGMTLVKKYQVEGAYGFRAQDLGHTVHLSVVDSITSRVAAGLYYTFLHGNPQLLHAGKTQATRQGHETGLALALPFGERFSVGITSKYTTMSTEVENPNAGKPDQKKTLVLDSTTAGATASGFTMDAGLNLHLGDVFNLGVAGYNLIPLRSVEAPISMGIGLSLLVSQALLIVADVKIDFDKYRDPGTTAPDGSHVPGNARTTARVGGGLEWAIGGVVPARVGVAYDSGLPGTFLSTGLGYQGRQFGVDLAFRQKVQGGTESALIAGLRLFLE